jgi:hypothetical protein
MVQVLLTTSAGGKVDAVKSNEQLRRVPVFLKTPPLMLTVP